MATSSRNNLSVPHGSTLDAGKSSAEFTSEFFPQLLKFLKEVPDDAKVKRPGTISVFFGKNGITACLLDWAYEARLFEDLGDLDAYTFEKLEAALANQDRKWLPMRKNGETERKVSTRAK